jgi:FtsP/CotA-like multicopper oxidase with cupredoxin domain
MTQRTRRLGLVLALALVVASALLATGPAAALPAGAPKIGMVCTPGTLSGGTRTFDLVAESGFVDTPDGNSVFMWSYRPAGDHFQVPGPVLCATQGETVVVNLTNTLPEASSIVFPGQDAAVTIPAGGAPGTPGLLTREAAAGGGTVSYGFTAGSPGSYLYESGSDPAKQVEMGLVGALVVRPSAANCPVVAGTGCAYNAGTRFDPKREFLLLLGTLDPDLHHAVETGGTYDFNALHNRYFTINGREFPDTVQDNDTALLPNQPYGALVRLAPTNGGGQPALLRMVNASPLNHPFHPHGNHTRQIAQDGRLVASTEHFGETIGSGQTIDYLMRWDDPDQWNPNNNPLPVAQPNYRNLTFKDGNTYYSGSPYLGYKGTLPTGTVQQNVCGEWYFPLHSHALNEFTNFDEGFGGMGTLLRVDPPGGCFTFPTATKITLGTLNSGSVTSLARDDGAYYKVNSTTTGTRTTDWYGQLSGVPAGAANLKVTYNGNDTPVPPNKTQTVSIWNWTTSAWVQLDSRAITSTADVTVGPVAVPAVAGSWDSYVGTGINKGLVRVRVLTTGGTTTNFVTGGDFMSLVYDAP